MRISTKDDILSIVIEQKDSGNRWKNSFNATYIEEITQKTGNAKKFNVFVKMLFSSISGSSDHVFLDILT
jgi:coiled-coil domain-containing protein 61